MPYNVFSNIRYTILAFWRERRSLVIYVFIGVVMSVMFSFISIFMPKLVIDELTFQVNATHFTFVVGSMGLLLILVGFLKSFAERKISDHDIGSTSRYILQTRVMEKLISMDYELMESPDIKKIQDKAEKAIRDNHTLANNLLQVLSILLINIFGFILYSGVILSVHPFIIILLICSAIVNWIILFFARKYEICTREAISKVDRKIWYIIESFRDKEMAKDIRLYSMYDLLSKISDGLTVKKRILNGKVANRLLIVQIVDAFAILIRDGISYAYLIYLLIQNHIKLGEFVLIFAAIASLAGWVSGILKQANDLLRASSELSDVRLLLDYSNSLNNNRRTEILSKFGEAPTIKLEDVEYTYVGANKSTLSKINFEIRSGERIAIVGSNGAGKTTLIKLITGLYHPTVGHIYLEGKDIREYNLEDYFTLFSVVFQDIHLLSATIAENVSQQILEYTDRKRVEHCLICAGLYDKVKTLPNGIDTLLVRQIHNNAIEFSGGEKQKLALARALYKDAPIIILDEPTASLDPIAESQIYKSYAELTKNKTSIYISHRLASTSFCDRIFLLDNGEVIEEGSHNELIKLKGKYAEMFSMQASYYREKVEGELNEP